MIIEKAEKESWIKSKWRPITGWAYIAICLFDFIFAPIWWTMIQVSEMGVVTQQWMPLTLDQGGLFHLSMGAILGVTAWSRGREKVAGVAGDFYPTSHFERETSFESQTPYTDNQNRGNGI